jgi:hypothetical protein
MALLDLPDYPAIRAALDVTLDAGLLPDALIGLPINVGAAEAEVLARDPAAATRTGVALQHVKNAAILLTAANLAPSLPAFTAQAFGSTSFQHKPVDWVARAAQLRQRADDELASVLQPAAVAPERPTMFAVAAGRRGR